MKYWSFICSYYAVDKKDLILIIKHFLFIFLCTFSIALFAQPMTKKKNSAEEAYQKRITQQNLHGVYIPKDLSDAFVQFNKLIEKPTIDKFRSLPEEEADRRLHFGFGKWISHNYSFYDGSRFSVYMNKLGLYDPDDMITFVIITYHRNLNKQKLDVKTLLENLIEKREKVKKERKLKGDIISEETRKVEVHPDSVKINKQ